MADDAAIVNVLTLLSKNFTELNQNVKDSSDKQESLSQQLVDSLKGILKVQYDQLKLNEKAAEDAKKRQTGIDNEKAQAEAKKETGKILKDIRDGQESLPLIGKYIKALNKGEDKEESVGLGLNNIATSFKNFTELNQNANKALNKGEDKEKSVGLGLNNIAKSVGSGLNNIAKSVGLGLNNIATSFKNFTELNQNANKALNKGEDKEESVGSGLNNIATSFKNFTELNQTVKDSSDKQESLSQQLVDSLKGLLKVQYDQLKLNEKAAEEAKQRQTGIDNEKAKKEADAEKDKDRKNLESIPLIGKYISTGFKSKEIGESLQKSLVPFTRNGYAALLKFSRKQKRTTATGLRGAVSRGIGKSAGGLAKVIGPLVKFLPVVLRFLGPLGIAAQLLLKAFKYLEGAIGFLISGAIALFGTYIFAWIASVKDIIAWYKALPKKIFKFFSEDLPLLFEAGIDKLKEIFTNIYNYLLEKIFQPLADYLYEAWEGVMAYWEEFKAAFNEKISAIADSIYETWEGVKIWYKEIKQSFNEWLEGFADGIYEAWEGIIAYKDELMASIRNMITNVKDAAVGMFTNIINFIKEKIDAVLNIGGKAIDAVKGWFGFGGGDEETIREEAKKELTPEDFPSGVVNRNAPPNVSVEFNDEAMKLYNDTLEKNRQQSEKMTESVGLLIETISSKELGTTVINNTAPAPTQSYSSGGRLRK